MRATILVSGARCGAKKSIIHDFKFTGKRVLVQFGFQKAEHNHIVVVGSPSGIFPPTCETV